MVFRRTVSIDAAPTGLRGLGQTRFYRDTEEIPKQINPTGLKSFLESSRFPRKIRFGWETEPTGPGAKAIEKWKTMVDFRITYTLSMQVNPLNPPYQGDFEDFENVNLFL